MHFPCRPLAPLLSVFFFSLSIVSAPAADDSPASRLADLRERIEKTSRLVAEADGYPAKAGRIDVQVAEWFANYIEWELANPEITKEALMGDRIFHPDAADGPEEAARLYRQHIERELDGSLALLDQAAARLREDRGWLELRDPDWSRMTFADGFFRTGGQAAFPAGFNMMLQELVDLSKHPGYADESRKRLDAFHAEMREIGVGVVSHGMSIPDFLSPDGGIRQDLLNRQVEEIERLTAKGFKVSVLLHWGGDAAVLEKRWPGITRYRGNGVGLDIDHPGSRELVREVGEGVFPVLGKLPGVVAWDMANEPFFDMDEWSPHGLRSYHLWLAERHGDIEQLNQRWRTEFGSFAEIRSPKDRPRERCSPGEWYDQVSFHNHRVTSFFGFVSGEIHRHAPGSLVHMKSQDNSSLGPMPAAVAHGIDREGLTPFCQLQGLDTRPLPVTEPRMAASDYEGSPYALHWLGQSFTFDFLTSLPPSCPVIDLEYHAFSINAIRVPDLPTDHGRVALWLAHLHGMVGNMAWYWHRRWGPDPFPAEYFKWWFRDSLSTQPLAAAGYFQTMLELNAVAPEVERLAAAPDRPLRLLVSMPSYIQDQAHIDALHRVYEGSCFHGLPVGFVTGDTLARDGVPDDCRMLVIPNVDRLSAGALAALETAGRKGVRLMSYGKRLPLLDSYGIPHPDKATAFLKQIPEIDAGAAEELSQRMIEALAPLTKERPLRVERTDTPGAFGVMHRSVETGEDILVLLVNVLNRPLTVRLTARDGSLPRGQDIINGEAVDGHRIDLPVRGVRLVRVQGIPGGTSSIQLVAPADRSVTYATPHGDQPRLAWRDPTRDLSKVLHYEVWLDGTPVDRVPAGGFGDFPSAGAGNHDPFRPYGFLPDARLAYYTPDLSHLPEGPHHWQIKAVDKDGRRRSSGGPSRFTIAAPPADTTVFVNHLGYLSDESKQVVVDAAAGDSDFEVLDPAGRIVFSGVLNRGAGTFGDHLSGDFSGLTEPGSYRVRVGADHSLWFPIGPEARLNYEAFLRKFRNAYRRKRCGDTTVNLIGKPCHLEDARIAGGARHGIVGGWHASSDVRKIMRILQPGLEGLLDLKRIADPPWDTGTESILDEIKWGNRYIHAMQLGSGALAQHQFLWCGATDWGESLNRYTNNQPGDADDRVLPEESLVIDMVSQSRFIKNQATIHRLYRDIDPEYARLCLEAATRCYDYFHKTWPVVTDYETTFCARPFMEPVTDLMPLAYGVRANLSMHLATGEPEYRQRAVDLADKIMALQEARHIADQDEVRGFFYRDSERSEIFDSQMAHGGLDGAEGAVNVIADLCANLPNHPHRPRWLECLRLYLVDYLLVLSQKNDFGIVPAYLSLSDHAGGQTGAKMTRRIGGLHYQYLCDNRGANKALARKAILLARGARLLDHPGLRQAAWRQIDWILGFNPMNRSTVYGVGQRQPALYKTSLEPGSDGMVVQGIGGGGRDMPYLREGHWRWCEMELHHTAWFAQAVLELLAPAD